MDHSQAPVLDALSGVRPIWVEPQWDASRNLAHPPSVEAFAARLDEHPDALGALVTSPTPYGTCADLAAIAAACQACHERGKPLIVDEAWGAHLPFHPGLPTWAMDSGADVCVEVPSPAELRLELVVLPLLRGRGVWRTGCYCRVM